MVIRQVAAVGFAGDVAERHAAIRHALDLVLAVDHLDVVADASSMCAAIWAWPSL